MNSIVQIPTRMQAILVGSAQQIMIGERPTPTLLPGQVLVQVAAAGVNRADLVQRAGHYPPPAGDSDILGLEVAGTVVAIAEDVESSWLGAEVFGLVPGGGYATYVRVLASHLIKKPQTMSMISAAGTAEVFLTAYQALFTIGELPAGGAVLIHAGASGVGTAAIQLAKARGVFVAVTVGSSEKGQSCAALGADLVVNYRQEDFLPRLKAAYPSGFNVIVDPVAGDYTAKNMQLLAMDGKIVVLAMLGGRSVPSFDLTQLFKRRGQLICSTLRNRSDAYKTQLTADFWREFSADLQSGRIQSLIFQVLPWTEADAAHALLASNQTTGKVVLSMPQSCCHND